MSLERTAVDGLGRRSRLRRLWLYRSNLMVDFVIATIRRLFDIVVALALTLLTLPIVIIAMLWAKFKNRPILTYSEFLGRSMRPISIAQLSTGGPMRHIPRLWAVLRGDFSLVGPEPMPSSLSCELKPAHLGRFQVRPGLASLFVIRDAANIAFECQNHADREMIHTSSLSRDLSILARSIPASLIGGASAEISEDLNILGIRIRNWTMDRAVSWILETAQNAKGSTLAFVNPDCLNKAFDQKGYRDILSRSAVVLPDGIGIHYACKMLGTPLAANVNGTDLFPRLCEALEASHQEIFFLGGRPGVTDDLCARVSERWPGTKIAGHHHGYFKRSDPEEEEIIDTINRSGATILLVAFGVPHQETWIDTNLDRLNIAVAIGVGGLFDFYSGRITRAPMWLRELGFEWAWRLLQEPGRMWRRYVIGNPLFLWRVWQSRHQTIKATSEPKSQGGNHVYN